MPDLQIICRPLDGWPGQLLDAKARESGGTFKMPFDRRVRKLRDELRRIGTSVAMIGTAHRESEISVTTGWPRADRQPQHPGVMVAADTKFGALKWYTDHFRDWTDNLHAIGLTLERLRLADLYGVTNRGQQYAGWKMLPGPITASGPSSILTMEKAAAFVAEQANRAGFNVSAHLILTHKKDWQQAYRQVASRSGEARNHGHLPQRQQGLLAPLPLAVRFRLESSSNERWGAHRRGSQRCRRQAPDVP
jgi:hypothetical protein